MKREYTLEEKIKYYQRKALNLEFAMKRANDRLKVLLERAAVPNRSASKKRNSKKVG